MGGTFDPVHLGHVRMGLEAKKQLGLTEVWYIPSGIPAYKMNRQEVSLAEHRMNMLRLGVEGTEGFRVSDMEMKRPGNTYTSDTIAELHREYPDVHFYFLLGGDSLDYMDAWHEPGEIFRYATVAVFRRKGFSEEKVREKAEMLRKKFGARIRFLTMEPFDSSSTVIRDIAGKGGDLSALLPEKVADYIRENGLYKEVRP